MRNRTEGRGEAASVGLHYRQAHGLFVGVEKIPSIEWARRGMGAANDVQDLSTALEPALSTTVRLVGTEATREQVLARAEDVVQGAGHGDLVIAFFGGYSDKRYDDVYLLPSDHDPESFLATSVSFRLVAAVLGSAPGVKTLLILDVGGAGAVGFDMSSYRVGSESGLMVSCGPSETAYSERRGGAMHGVFPYALVEALRAVQEGKTAWSVPLIDWFDSAYNGTTRRKPQHPILMGTLSPNLEIRSRNADRRRSGTGIELKGRP